jgi:hypothetical protein
MPRTIVNKQTILRMLCPEYDEVWHLRNVIIPRRSITGRLVWGTVWRRRDDGRWIYKKYVGNPDIRFLFKQARNKIPR